MYRYYHYVYDDEITDIMIGAAANGMDYAGIGSLPSSELQYADEINPITDNDQHNQNRMQRGCSFFSDSGLVEGNLSSSNSPTKPNPEDYKPSKSMQSQMHHVGGNANKGTKADASIGEKWTGKTDKRNNMEGESSDGVTLSKFPLSVKDGQARYVTVRHFKGKVYVDIRAFFESNGKYLPTKKGITLTAREFKAMTMINRQLTTAVQGGTYM